MKKFTLRLISLSMLALSACGNSGETGKSDVDQASSAKTSAQVLGAFNADSAYNFVKDQVAFGPRVPGTQGHADCRKYLIDKLSKYTDSVIVQDGEVEAFNGTKLPITNIIAGFNTHATRRVLLVAHWDTRPWADNEPSMHLRQQPILGANDGGSGVGVILEIARNLALKKPNVGVDILLTDAEDYGNSDGFGPNTETWCLGTQYWIENMVPYTIDNLPDYGILLDMVGGKNARFHYEMFAAENAKTPTVKVWSEAKKLGYDNVFVSSVGGAVTDDHYFLTNAGIPTTDIIETLNEETMSFPPTWHTHSDDMSNISRSSLKAVGETVLNVLYKEKAY